MKRDKRSEYVSSLRLNHGEPNAAPEWQAKTPKQSRKSVVACPLEGLVRLILKGGEYQCLPTYR